MNEDRKKEKALVLGLFLAYLCIAPACFGLFVYMLLMGRGGGVPNPSPRMVTLSKIIVMMGIFFLVLAFGYLLPVLLSHKRRKHK